MGGETDQLEYYLSSLDELGEVLINADRARSVGVGILRLTLGTVMASKGAIFLYNNQDNQISFLSTRGVEPHDPFKPTKAFLAKLEKESFFGVWEYLNMFMAQIMLDVLFL